jgi:riboflavin biosynthesis pyrimidine reductase
LQTGLGSHKSDSSASSRDKADEAFEREQTAALRSRVDAIITGVVLVVGKIYQLEMKEKGGQSAPRKLLVSVSSIRPDDGFF